MKVKEVIQYAHEKSEIGEESEAMFFSLYTYENREVEVLGKKKEFNQKVLHHWLISVS